MWLREHAKRDMPTAVRLLHNSKVLGIKDVLWHKKICIVCNGSSKFRSTRTVNTYEGLHLYTYFLGTTVIPTPELIRLKCVSE